MNDCMRDTAFLGRPALAKGKVRDMYDLGDSLLMVVTDRISAFDVVFDELIPDKGKVLNGISAFWFDQTAQLMPNHVISTDPSKYPDGLSAFAGRPLTIDRSTYESASASNFRNRALAWTLRGRDRLYGAPDEVLDLYTRQSCLAVTARDLAIMGATLADGGVNPVTGQRVLDQALCHHVLAVMIIAGLYESSGDWFYRVGLPGKSGIGGGIVTVSPGKAGLGSYSPPLDAAGNSVRGQLSARYLSQRLGLDLLTSAPAR